MCTAEAPGGMPPAPGPPGRRPRPPGAGVSRPAACAPGRGQETVQEPASRAAEDGPRVKRKRQGHLRGRLGDVLGVPQEEREAVVEHLQRREARGAQERKEQEERGPQGCDGLREEVEEHAVDHVAPAGDVCARAQHIGKHGLGLEQVHIHLAGVDEARDLAGVAQQDPRNAEARGRDGPQEHHVAEGVPADSSADALEEQDPEEHEGRVVQDHAQHLGHEGDAVLHGRGEVEAHLVAEQAQRAGAASIRHCYPPFLSPIGVNPADCGAVHHRRDTSQCRDVGRLTRRGAQERHPAPLHHGQRGPVRHVGEGEDA